MPVPPFRPLAGLTRTLVILLGATFAFEGVGWVMEWRMVREGESDEILLWGGLAWLLYTLAQLTVGVLVLVWLRRSHLNLRALGWTRLRFTPGWVVGWWFVPIANLFKPYQVVAEIQTASGLPPDAPRGETPDLVFGWWLLWILNMVLARATGRTEGELGLWVGSASLLVELFAAVALVRVLWSIQDRQGGGPEPAPVAPALG